jgi:hypothetical protein
MDTAMARKPRWNKQPIVDGVSEIQLLSWKYFHDFVYQEMLERRSYVWRGQRNDSWKLASTLDRALVGKSSAKLRAKHIEDFNISSVRGRRGPSPPSILSENDWCALGCVRAVS